jgi:hypothetical protein
MAKPVDGTGGDRDNNIQLGEENDGKPGSPEGSAVATSTGGASDPDTSATFDLSMPTPVQNMNGLSVSEIIEFVQTRLSDIDGQIRDLAGDAAMRKHRSEELREFQDAVRSLVGPGGNYDSVGNPDDDDHDAERAKMNDDAGARLDKASADLKDNPLLVSHLQALKAKIFAPGEDGSRISAEQLQKELDWAKDQLTSINSDNEMTMMRLNSMMQLRSQVISSASNMQASINEGMKTVIGNMRA